MRASSGPTAEPPNRPDRPPSRRSPAAGAVRSGRFGPRAHFSAARAYFELKNEARGCELIQQAIAGASEDVEFKNQVNFYAARCSAPPRRPPQRPPLKAVAPRLSTPRRRPLPRLHTRG